MDVSANLIITLYSQRITASFEDYGHEAHRALIRASGGAAIQPIANGMDFSQGFDFSNMAVLPAVPAGGMPPMEAESITENEVLSCIAGSSINYTAAEEGHAGICDIFIAKSDRALLETPATSLFCDDNDRIIGIAAVADDGTGCHITADKAILSTRGFGANKERLDARNPGESA